MRSLTKISEERHCLSAVKTRRPADIIGRLIPTSEDRARIQ